MTILTGGSNLTGIAQYNERLILQIIRRTGGLPKADIARMTNLSAQTASVIINRLIAQQLLRKQQPLITPGKVGQPAIPVALNPEGAFSLGVKIGRRSLDVVLINFTGTIIQKISHCYPYPDPDFIFPAIAADLQTLRLNLSASQRKRLLGIGIATPYNLGGWQREVNIPAAVTAQWNTINIKQRVQTTQPETVWLVNDATAACIASLEFDNPRTFNNYLYLFIGTFVGGGIIMNRTLYNGSFNNAGAVGSMPLPRHYAAEPAEAELADPRPVQLIHCASRYLLNQRFEAAGINPEQALLAFADTQPNHGPPPEHQQIVDHWLKKTAPALAYAITTASSIIDVEGVIIDGLLPSPLTRELTSLTRSALRELNQEGLNTPQLHAGSIGNAARALGGAFLPFYTHFAPDRNLLVSSESHPLHAF